MIDGGRIRDARLHLKEQTGGKKGSQSWLAYTIGAHPTSVSDWERGANEPSPRHLKSIAEALGVAVESLYADSDDEEDATVNEQELVNALHAVVKALGRTGAAA